MDFFKKLIIEIGSEIIVIAVFFVAAFILVLVGKLDSTLFTYITLAILGYLLIKSLLTIYLNFVFQIRNGFGDNRSANFLTFDMMKFILILIAIISIIILGLNRVLQNETIATLLGGLVGSLLTMKGSYSDIKIDKETLDELKAERK